MEPPFEIFSDDSDGRAVGMQEMLAWMEHAIEDHHADFQQVINVLVDLVRPGTSENSHDVKPMWAGAMWVLGFGAVAEQVAAMYLNTMPWGIGFAISVEQDFKFEALSDDAKYAVVRSMCAVINMGGLAAEMTPEGTIRINHDDGTSTDLTTDDIVGQFRHEIEQELGPDAPPRDGDDRWRRWGV